MGNAMNLLYLCTKYSQARNYLHTCIFACISQKKFNVTLNSWLSYSDAFVEKHVTDNLTNILKNFSKLEKCELLLKIIICTPHRTGD